MKFEAGGNFFLFDDDADDDYIFMTLLNFSNLYDRLIIFLDFHFYCVFVFAAVDFLRSPSKLLFGNLNENKVILQTRT